LANDEPGAGLGAFKSQGTAFMLKGIGMITCQHVLSDGMYTFRHDDPTNKYKIEVVVQNRDHDLAILRIDAEKLYYLEASERPILNYHNDITLAGFPNYFLGHKPYIAPGKVVSARRIHGIDMITINTPIEYGNSGGPVLDSSGKVVGVASSGGDKSRSDFFGYIPINNLQRLLTNE